MKRFAPVLATSALALGFVAAMGFSTVSSASLPTPSSVKMTTPTWGLPVPCPPHCTTIPTVATSP